MNTATDDHRFLISATWGDQAYADTLAEARAARTQLADDHGASQRDITIIDRGPAPQKEED